MKSSILAGVYQIKNIVNNKIYIGSTRNFKKRYHEHSHLLRKGIHQNRYLQNAYNKYGEDNFIIELIEICKEDELTIREQHYIDVLNPEYNITKEVIRNTPSKESRELMSKSRIKGFKEGKIIPYQAKPVYQYSLDGVFIKKWDSCQIAADTLKIQASDINSCSNNVRKKSAGGYLWTKIYYDTIPKYDRITNKGKSFNTKKIILQHKDTQEILIFNSYKECAGFFGVAPPCISHAINNQTMYKKYKILL